MLQNNTFESTLSRLEIRKWYAVAALPTVIPLNRNSSQCKGDLH